MPADSAPGFAPFTLTHFVVVGVFVLATAALIAFGRAHRATPALRRVELTLGVFNLVFWFAVAAWWLRPANFTWGRALPLHLCDLASLLAPIAMLANRRMLTSLLYYWAFGLSSQAFITPTLSEGPGEVYFWLFWYQHATIVGTAAYQVGVHGFLPSWRDFASSCLLTYVYLAVAMLANYFTGGNYGYVGPSQPAAPTIVDALGPWPLRVLWIAILVHIVFAGLTLPGWFLRRGRAFPRAAHPASDTPHAPQSPA